MSLFEWKLNKEVEERKVRAKLEKAYEQEKLKVTISIHLIYFI